MMDQLHPEPTNPNTRKPKAQRAPQPTPEAQTAEKPITVLVPEPLLKKVRVLAAITGESMSDMVTQGLKARVKRDLGQALEALREEG